MSKNRNPYEEGAPDFTPSQNSLPAANKRRHHRSPLRVPARILCHPTAEEEWHDGICTDISDSGVRIETEAELALDDVVELVLYGKKQTVFSNYVRIVYHSGNVYGACFIRVE